MNIPHLFTSTKRLLANRQNALKSTGPKTESGKHRISINAFKHGLSGQNLCLQADECIPYFRLALDYIEDLRPVGVREEQLAQKIIDGNWRLNRASAIENNLLNNDLVAQAEHLVSDDPRSVGMAAQAEAWRADCAGPKAIETLGRHESRIARTLFKMTSEFDRLQARRQNKSADLNLDDAFVREESRAWQFLSKSLERYRGAEPQPQPQPKPAEVVPETPQPLVKTAASGMALNCDFMPAPAPTASETFSRFLKNRQSAAASNPPTPGLLREIPKQRP